MKMCGACCLFLEKSHDTCHGDLQQSVLPAGVSSGLTLGYRFQGNNNLQQLEKLVRQSLQGQVLQRPQDLDIETHSLRVVRTAEYCVKYHRWGAAAWKTAEDLVQ